VLIAPLLGINQGDSATVATALASRFDYVADQERLHVLDSWPTRDEVAAVMTEHGGRLVGDCDDFAFAAAYALHDLGIGARVVTGICETGGGHMVCEDLHGNVIDNRFPGRVLTWHELERIGYRSTQMNALDFEEHAPRWRYVKVGADGKRDYA
jgi:hypothetical protein